MKIVIDIPDEEYKECKNRFNAIYKDGYLNYDLNTALVLYVANGMPLPKGHGRLLDEKVIIENAVKGLNGIYDLTDMPDYIAGLPAIIPAESEEEVTETSMHHLICAMCDNDKCVRGTKECEFEQWKEKEERG